MVPLLIFGFGIGCVYALVGAGFSLVFKTTGIVNFAQGSFVTLGALGAYAVLAEGVPYAIAVLAGVGLAVAGGLILWYVVLTPLIMRDAPGYAPNIATLVYLAVVTDLMLLWQGANPNLLPVWAPQTQFHVLGANVSIMYLYVVLAAAVLLGGLGIVLRATRLGIGMRACAVDRETSQLLGLSPRLLGGMAMGLMAGIGGVGGVLIGSLQYAANDSGVTFGRYGFVAAVAGGFGSLPGAVIAGVLLGILQELLARYVSSDFSDAFALILLLCILVVRPGGLMGARIRFMSR
jgi:branched-chain amino acid transport system permease protein